MEIQLSPVDHAMLVGQMTVINYLKRQQEQLERELTVAVLMTYGVDIRKEGVVLDLEHGVVHVPRPTAESEQ